MINALTSAARLRRCVCALRLGAAGRDPDLVWLADGVAAYLDGAERGASLDMVLGVTVTPYAAPWWQGHGFAARDSLIGELAALMPGTAPSGIAKEIERRARHYARNEWPRHMKLESLPAATSPDAILLHRLHHCGVKWPLGWRRILELLETRLQLSRLVMQTSTEGKSTHGNRDNAGSTQHGDHGIREARSGKGRGR